MLSGLCFTASDYFFGIFWSLCCLSFVLQLLITPLVSFGHYVVCPSSIYGFWLPLWYLFFKSRLQFYNILIRFLFPPDRKWKSSLRNVCITNEHIYVPFVVKYNPVLSSSMIYHMSSTTGASGGAGTAYPSRASEFAIGFSGVRVDLSLFFCILSFR